MTKLFVGGLPYSTTNEELQSMFASYGNIISAAIITDKFTGQSKGFGFVEMESDEAAQKAISELNETELNGRKIGVSVARPREERPPRSGGGFSQGGQFDRGGQRGFSHDRGDRQRGGRR